MIHSRDYRSCGGCHRDGHGGLRVGLGLGGSHSGSLAGSATELQHSNTVAHCHVTNQETQLPVELEGFRAVEEEMVHL
jgi:hypothetical protein